jgi:hypothetical protein
MDLVDRADPATEKVARKTIELARHRESVMLFGCGSVSLKPCQAHRRTQSSYWDEVELVFLRRGGRETEH